MEEDLGKYSLVRNLKQAQVLASITVQGANDTTIEPGFSIGKTYPYLNFSIFYRPK